MARLVDVAAVMRSKNAGPFLITVDLLFDSPEVYQRVLQSGVLTPERLAPLYKVSPETVEVIPFDPVSAIKVTVPRVASSGSPDDTDVYGAQQYAPLLALEVTL